LLSDKQKDAKICTTCCLLTPLINQRLRIVLDWPVGLDFGLVQGGGAGRTTPRALVAVGKMVVWPFGRGPMPTQGIGAIVQIQLSDLKKV
jgi:hypothetical protein